MGNITDSDALDSARRLEQLGREDNALQPCSLPIVFGNRLSPAQSEDTSAC